jgi:signal transduction histidine kinase/CheY-like chemotaxis protein
VALLVQAAGALLALTVTAAFAALILSALQQRDDSRAVALSTRTVAQVERVQQLALDLETGLRGYTITGQEPFLAPYWSARDRFSLQAQRLIALVGQRSTQSVLAARLLRDGQDYTRAYGDRLIAQQRRSGPSAVDVAAIEEGRRRMDVLRQDLLALRSMEQRRVEAQRTSADHTATRTVVFGGVGLIVSLALLAALLLFLLRHRAEIERARAVAESASQAKNDFLSRMSHELRTPLNSVLGFGQLLQLDPRLEGSQREHVQHIVRGGQHLLELINEVLDISRIEGGTLSLSPESVDVAEAVREALALVRPLAEEREIVLDVRAEHAGFVLADHQRLKQVLLNLLSNAIKYNRHAGIVVVTCERFDGRVALEVTDTGPGVPSDRLERLFEPFDRLGAEHRGIEGTGLGLALSRSLIEVMGGTLTAANRPVEGSRFRIELPAAEAPAVVAAPAAAEPEAVAGGARVLYIEDNTANFRLVKELLTSRRPVEILPAIQGRLGVELARQHLPDVILLDLHLPDMSGSLVLAQLKADPTTAAIPVIIVTADATPGRARRLLESGALACVTKPFDVPEFLRTVESALASSA